MELESIMQESAEHLQKTFYGKKFYFSYSSLSKLMWNPAVFYQLYVLGNKEEKHDAHLVQGKVIHALLLEEEKFNDQFIVSPGKLPGDSIKQVVDRVFYHHKEIAQSGDQRTNLEEFDGAILDVMRDMNYFQALKTDQQRLDKIITLEATNYWAFLKTKGDKYLIDQDTYDFCKNSVDLVKTNKEVCELIGLNINEFDNKMVLNESLLQSELVDRNFGIKGIIDNLVFDHDKKIIYINDIKTTSKDLKDFSESVEYYAYWMQAIMYVSLVTTKYKDLIDNGYNIKFHFVVIDRGFQVYPFPVSETTLNTWLNRFFSMIEKAAWHYTNQSYHLPYDFATGQVTL
jgi:hypothetical protein